MKIKFSKMFRALFVVTFFFAGASLSLADSPGGSDPTGCTGEFVARKCSSSDQYCPNEDVPLERDCVGLNGPPQCCGWPEDYWTYLSQYGEGYCGKGTKQPDCSGSANYCGKYSSPNGCGDCQGTKTPDDSCKYNTCVGSQCNDPNCGWKIDGVKQPDCPTSCLWTLKNQTCGTDGCGGTCWGKLPVCSVDDSCKYDTCVGEQCTDPGCGWKIDGVKTDGVCACTPNDSCKYDTCVGKQCNDPVCGWKIDGVKTDGQCCVDTSWSPDPSTSCSSFTQTSNCGNTRQANGTKVPNFTSADCSDLCGSAVNSCGETVTCSCSGSTNTCVNNHCVSPPPPPSGDGCTASCDGVWTACVGGTQWQTCTKTDCSTWKDVQNCNNCECSNVFSGGGGGGCSLGKRCDGCHCVPIPGPDCNPYTQADCSVYGLTCGTYSNRCFGFPDINCGQCIAPAVCVSGSCVPPSPTPTPTPTPNPTPPPTCFCGPVSCIDSCGGNTCCPYYPPSYVGCNEGCDEYDYLCKPGLICYPRLVNNGDTGRCRLPGNPEDQTCTSTAVWSASLTADPSSGPATLVSNLTTTINNPYAGENYTISPHCGGAVSPTNINGLNFTCTYPSAGTYNPSVIVIAQKTGVDKFATTTINVADPCTPDCSNAANVCKDTSYTSLNNCGNCTGTKLPDHFCDDPDCSSLCGIQNKICRPDCGGNCAGVDCGKKDCGPCNSGTWKETAP